MYIRVNLASAGGGAPVVVVAAAVVFVPAAVVFVPAAVVFVLPTVVFDPDDLDDPQAATVNPPLTRTAINRRRLLSDVIPDMTCTPPPWMFV
jgi:hypothetical protein